jgi:exopolyphosphatase/guanosine-5'-triphosphate,3'-diphosphate pyrophosphatase
MDLRIYTSRNNFDVPAHATGHLLREFEKVFRVPLRVQWFPGSRNANKLVQTARKL